MIEKKRKLIESLNEKKNEYTKLSIEYKEKKSKLLLETDFNEVLNKSRPTVDDKNAYISIQTLDLREKKELLYNEIEYIKLQIELCNDEIKLNSEW